MNPDARLFINVISTALAIAAPLQVYAQGSFPSSSIRLVYGYAAGGGGDIAARLLAAKLTTQINASVIVDNKPGASGHTANEIVAKSRPDGYTLVYNDASVATGPALGEKLGYDFFRDFAPVSYVSSSPHALVVHASVPSNTLAEFIAHVRANPDKLAYASAGTGSNNHLSPLLFLQVNGLKALHVPYKGGGLMMQDVGAGRVQWATTSLPTVLPLVREKRIKVLACGGLKRSPLLPEVPTFSESAMPGFEVGSWHGIMVAAQTPSAIIKRLNGEIVKALQDPDLRGRLEQQGTEPRGTTPEEYTAHLKSETERWSKVIRTAGIKSE